MSVGSPTILYSVLTLSPKALCSRCFMRLTARWVMSMPIQRRLSCWATTIAVPQPQNGSSTTSPSLLLTPDDALEQGLGLLRRVAEALGRLRC